MNQLNGLCGWRLQHCDSEENSELQKITDSTVTKMIAGFTINPILMSIPTPQNEQGIK